MKKTAILLIALSILVLGGCGELYESDKAHSSDKWDSVPDGYKYGLVLKATTSPSAYVDAYVSVKDMNVNFRETVFYADWTYIIDYDLPPLIWDGGKWIDYYEHDHEPFWIDMGSRYYYQDIIDLEKGVSADLVSEAMVVDRQEKQAAYDENAKVLSNYSGTVVYVKKTGGKHYISIKGLFGETRKVVIENLESLDLAVGNWYEITVDGNNHLVDVKIAD